MRHCGHALTRRGVIDIICRCFDAAFLPLFAKDVIRGDIMRWRRFREVRRCFVDAACDFSSLRVTGLETFDGATEPEHERQIVLRLFRFLSLFSRNNI
jgi:hypothetical protein